MCGALMCLPSPVWWRHETSAFLVGQANNSGMASGFLGTLVGEGHKKVFGGLDSGRLPWWLRWEASSCNAGDQSSIPGLGSSPEEGMATHSSILAWRIPMNKGAWRATVYGVAKSQTRLSD